MVRVTNVLCRVPVIKFRKGGLGQARAPSTGASAGAAPAVATPAAAPVQQPAAAAMSTNTVPDIDLPLRYRRLPLSEEEIEYINGGGIV